MLASHSLLTLFFAITTVSAQNVCLSSPYDSLSCLANNINAGRICTKSLPTATATITTTTTVQDKATVVAIGTATSQATESSVNVETSTVTITTGYPSTTTVTSTQCNEFSATITTYVSASATVKARDTLPSTSCDSNALATLDVDRLATACSCLGVKAPTTTVTYWVTASVPVTTTSVDGLAATTTALLLDRVTITEQVAPPPVTETCTTTTSKTSTSTVSLAAPTYDAVWGPAASCADVSASSGHLLGDSVTDDTQAAGLCQDLCTQEPDCKGLFVQRWFPSTDGVNPFYACLINKEYFGANDIECGHPQDIYGDGKAYDACGRGVAQGS